tara:strand:+ start:4859 stop:5254 length:396 start_codon:yes stop_codon:yes gene_type:complete
MPKVGGKKYDYTDAGMKAAKSARRRQSRRKAGGDEFANKFPQTAKDIARKSAGLAPEDQAKVTRKEGPMDTGGLDSRDKTSFETPKKEFEPAWVGRERKRDRKARKRKKEKRDFADPGPDAAAEHIRNFRK